MLEKFPNLFRKFQSFLKRAGLFQNLKIYENENFPESSRNFKNLSTKFEGFLEF